LRQPSPKTGREANSQAVAFFKKIDAKTFYDYFMTLGRCALDRDSPEESKVFCALLARGRPTSPTRDTNRP
jgi:hypothetical protein